MRSLTVSRALLLWPCTAFALSALLATGCNKESPPAAEQARAPVAGGLQERPAVEPANAPAIQPVASPTPAERAGTPAAAEAAEPSAAAVSRVAEANFELTITGVGAVEAGKPARAEIVLDAKAPFHVNEKYPYKFKLKETPGLTFPNPVVGKDAVTLEKTRAKLTVPFTAEKSGKSTLAGQFSFSVCTDDKCLIEKRDLSLSIDAKGP